MLSTKSNLTSTIPGADTAPDHAPNAAGLANHLKTNLTHVQPAVNDDYQLPTKFSITLENTGVYHGPQVYETTAELLNNLLQKNHTNHHVYFSETGGFHNHLAHHLLSSFALGATPEELQLAYDTMASWQRPRCAIDEALVNKMDDPQEFQSMLGDDRHFHNYLAFFTQKFEKEDWKKVATEYLFSDTVIAEDLFVRMFAGIWHNLILFGYGVEFGQPGIVAESLAGACVHSNVFGPYLLGCEKLANKSSRSCKPLLGLLEDIQNNPALCDKDHWHGGNSFAYDDNITSNAPPGMAELASQWKVDSPEDLPYRTVEMINVNAFIAGAAQRPNKVVKIDFVFVHQVNASIFFSVFLQQDWINDAFKIRLLEWYTRLNLLTYAAGLAPPLLTNEIVEYKPLEPKSTWSSIMHRAHAIQDDGHLSKLLRALAHGEKVSQPWEQNHAQEDKPLLPIKGGMWLLLANMAIDSTENEPEIIKRWLRGAGSDEAWAEFPDRAP